MWPAQSYDVCSPSAQQLWLVDPCGWEMYSRSYSEGSVERIHQEPDCIVWSLPTSPYIFICSAVCSSTAAHATTMQPLWASLQSGPFIRSCVLILPVLACSVVQSLHWVNPQMFREVLIWRNALDILGVSNVLIGILICHGDIDTFLVTLAVSAASSIVIFQYSQVIF